jgi:hypothetical protein
LDNFVTLFDFHLQSDYWFCLHEKFFLQQMVLWETEICLSQPVIVNR